MARTPVSAGDLSTGVNYETGLQGAVYTGDNFDILFDALDRMQRDPDATFVSDAFDYSASFGALGDFLGEDAETLSDPATRAISDQYALHFSGQIYLEAGRHSFYNMTDDGFRLTIGDELVAQYSDPRASGLSEGQVTISESGWYTINVDYFEQWGASELRIGHRLNGGPLEYLGGDRLRYAAETTDVPTNTAPDSRNDLMQVAEDGRLTLDPLANDTDADGDSLTLGAVSDPDHGTVTRNADGTLTYVPEADFHGRDSFTYTISDGRGGEDTARVVIDVSPVNDLPEAAGDGGFSVAAGQTLMLDISELLSNDRDADGNTLSIVDLRDVRNGTADIVGDQIRFIGNGAGDASFRYVLGDGHGGRDTATVSIAVTGGATGTPEENQAPDARNDIRRIDEDGQLTLNPLENDIDPDGDPLTMYRLDQPEHGTVVRNPNGTVTYVPDDNFNGRDSFVYFVNDGNGRINAARVVVNVTAVNDAPQANDDDGYEVEAGQVLTIDIADLLQNDSDADGDDLSIIRLDDVTNGSAEIVGDQIRFVGNGEGEGSFSYLVGDGNGGRDEARVLVDVSGSGDDGGSDGGDTGSGDGGGSDGGDTGSGDGGGSDGGDSGSGDDGGSDGGDSGSGGHHHGGSFEPIDPPQTPAEIAAFVNMVMNMPEDTMEGHPAGMANHMATLNLVDRSEATHVAIGHGDWNDPSTWHNGEVPGEGARVLIPEGISVGYSQQNDASIFTVRVDGELHFATDQDSRLLVDTLVVSPSGRLEIGTAHDPIEAGTSVDIVFADNGNIDVGWDPALLSRGMVAFGEVDIAGQEKGSHLKVQVDAMAGDTTLTLAEAPTGWQVGDKLVLTGTYQQGFYWNNDIQATDFAESQDEELVITAISGNTITLDRPLTFDHDTPRDDLKAYVANMTRNVTFSSEGGEDLPAHQRGHVMFMHNDNIDVRYAGFNDLGRTDKSEFAGPASAFGGVGNLSPDTNVEARYSFHIHEAGVADIENPASVVGNVVDGSPGWGFVQHSSNADLTNNVAYDVWGASFVAEDGNETGTWYRNIAIKGEGWAAGDIAVKHSEVDGNDGRTGDGFWFAGRLVEVVENVAANTTHGFVWLHRGERDSIDPDTMHQSELGYGRDMLETDKAPIQGFRDNEAFGTNTGLIVVKQNPDQAHDVRSVFDGFLNWETREGVAVSYTGHYTYLDFDLVGQRPEPGEVTDRAYQGVNLGGNAFDMVFNNIRIDGFEHAFNLTDNANVDTGSGQGLENVVIDGEFLNISNSDIRQNYPGQLQVLGGGDLTPGRLEFRLTADRIVSDREHMFFDGIKTDSIGDIERNFDLEQQGIWGVDQFLNANGYWELPDGTPVALVEDYISDRATGEMVKQMLVFELDYSAAMLERSYSLNGVVDLGGRGAIARDDRVSTSVNQDLIIDLVANDSDPDGGRVYVDGLIDSRNGTVYMQDDGTVLYRPNEGFVGEDRFTYWAADEEGNFTRGEAFVTVMPGSGMMHEAMQADMFDM
jgi:hypothetical protein